MTQAKIVRSNWEASGNGEEMPASHGYDELSLVGSSDKDSNNKRCNPGRTKNKRNWFRW